MSSLVLYGGGGLGVEVARFLRERAEASDSPEKIVVTDVIDSGIPRVQDLNQILNANLKVHESYTSVENIQSKEILIAVGASPTRHEIYTKLRGVGCKFHSVVHPSAAISKDAVIGAGCIIAPLSVLGAFCKLGDNVVVNVHVSIGHDACIGESSIISPHVAIGGAVECGTSTFFGAGVVVNPQVSIGDFCKLSAGGTVISDVAAGNFLLPPTAKCIKLFDSATGRSLLEG